MKSVSWNVRACIAIDPPQESLDVSFISDTLSQRDIEAMVASLVKYRLSDMRVLMQYLLDELYRGVRWYE